MNKNQSIGMYVILGIMVLAFVSMLFSGPTSSTEEISYTAFMQKLENKEIKKYESKTDFSLAKKNVMDEIRELILLKPIYINKIKSGTKLVYKHLKLKFEGTRPINNSCWYISYNYK